MNLVFRDRIGNGHRKTWAEPQIIVSKAGRRKGMGVTFLPEVVKMAWSWELQDSTVISRKSRPRIRPGLGLPWLWPTAGFLWFHFSPLKTEVLSKSCNPLAAHFVRRWPFKPSWVWAVKDCSIPRFQTIPRACPPRAVYCQEECLGAWPGFEFQAYSLLASPLGRVLYRSEPWVSHWKRQPRGVLVRMTRSGQSSSLDK